MNIRLEGENNPKAKKKTNNGPQKKEVWIGLALVSQPSGVTTLGDADKAYVNVLSLATDEKGFWESVEKAVEELELVLNSMEDAEPLKIRVSNHFVHPYIIDLAAEAEKTGEVKFDTFQAFDAE